MLTLISCEDRISFEDSISALPCSDNNIINIQSEYCCNLEAGYFTCDIIVEEDINYISPQSFNWMPNACASVFDKITFTNGSVDTDFNIVDTYHYILTEELHSSCNGRHDHYNNIIQQNEFVAIDLMNEKFGETPIHLELKTRRLYNQDASPADQVDIYTIEQQRANSNVYNFSRQHNIGREGYDNRAATFHDQIKLDNKTYHSVVELKVSVNSITQPYNRFFINEEHGFFAFYIHQELWVKK